MFSFVKKKIPILLRFEEIQARTSVHKKGISVLEKDLSKNDEK